MADEPAIVTQNLGKRFMLSEVQAYKTLRDSLTHGVRKMFRGGGRGRRDELWALRGISIEIRRGEAVGIIGGNGAGKSTLLKILSRITEPTEGTGIVRGRVGSLLEVGTGFHPELTGRENIYLNGAIIGMPRAEIRRQFDAIVAFAEVERFIDTPVKLYSSGMYMRLAFAVAAHLEPDILIVDEVLAVGDAAFQKKCLGRMNDVTHAGRTVLFVSHNMGAVRSLCSRVILLRKGVVVADGPTEAIIAQYLTGNDDMRDIAQVQAAVDALPDDPAIRLLRVSIGQGGRATVSITDVDPVEIEIDYEVKQSVDGLRVYFDWCDEIGDALIRSFHDEHALARERIEPGRYRSRAVIPGELLAPRMYTLVVRATIHNQRTCTGGGIRIPVHVQATGRVNRAYPGEPVRAKIMPNIRWEITCLNRS